MTLYVGWKIHDDKERHIKFNPRNFQLIFVYHFKNFLIKYLKLIFFRNFQNFKSF